MYVQPIEKANFVVCLRSLMYSDIHCHSLVPMWYPKTIGTHAVPDNSGAPSMARTSRTRLTQEHLNRLKEPAKGEATSWCGSLPRFGVRMRAGSTRKTFIIKYRTVEGRQRKMTLGDWPALSVDDARRMARQHLGDVERGSDPVGDVQKDRDAPTMADLAQAFMEAKASRKRESSLRDDRANWRNLILPVLGKRRIQDVTSRDIEALHQSLAKTRYQANRVLALLSSAFSLVVLWGWRDDNPVKGVERFREERRERFLSTDELARLVAVLRSHPNRRSANAVLLLAMTGARRGEALNATWEQFDIQAGVWTKPSSHTKQKKLHRVPLSGPARMLLAEMAEQAGDDTLPSSFLFPGDADGKPLGDVKNFWKSVCRQAEIRDFRLHDLRHQYASILASSGQSLAIVGRLLGHTQPSTTARYAHLFDDPLREATERVGAHFDRPGDEAEVVPIRRG